MTKKNKISSRKGATFLKIVLLGTVSLLLTGCTVTEIPVTDHPLSVTVPLNTYFMSQKTFTLGERFVIKDKTKTPVFYVKGKALSIGDKLTLRDAAGNELAYIKEKVLHIGEYYNIYRDSHLFASVKKKLFHFKDKFTVKIPGLDDYKVSGNFGRHHYRFVRNGKVVALVSKKFLSFGDKYRIEIVPEEDDVLILSTVVIIDMVSHNGNETVNIIE